MKNNKPLKKLWKFTMLMKMLGVINHEELLQMEKKIKSQ
jgi:hypothetical protein